MKITFQLFSMSNFLTKILGPTLRYQYLYLSNVVVNSFNFVNSSGMLMTLEFPLALYTLSKTCYLICLTPNHSIL